MMPRKERASFWTQSVHMKQMGLPGPCPCHSASSCCFNFSACLLPSHSADTRTPATRPSHLKSLALH